MESVVWAYRAQDPLRRRSAALNLGTILRKTHQYLLDSIAQGVPCDSVSYCEGWFGREEH